MLNVGLAANSNIKNGFLRLVTVKRNFATKTDKKSTTPTKIFLQFLERNRQDMREYTEPVYQFEKIR